MSFHRNTYLMERIHSIFWTVLSGLLLAGCGAAQAGETPEQPPVHVVLVLGATSNTPVLNGEAAEDVIWQVCSCAGSTVTMIVADGEPYTFDEMTTPDIPSGYSNTRKQRIIEGRVADVTAAIQEAEALSPHADYLGAIEMASRVLQGFEDNYEKKLLIFGSMLSDVEPLDFSGQYLDYLDMGGVMENLEQSYSVPDLKDIDVKVYNMGDTCAPQKDLTNLERKILKELWTEVLEAGEPSGLAFASDLPSGLMYEGLPEVDTVPVVLDSTALEELEEVGLEAVDAVSFHEEMIGFEPGTAELLNEGGAAEAVDAVARYMDEKDMSALLVGCTARWGGQEASIALSYERACVVKSLFVDAGVSPDRLQVVGAGWMSPFYKNDQDAQGNLDEAIAPANRCTVWVPWDTESARQVLNSPNAGKFQFGER